jgi:uncharacterized protein
MTGTKRPGAPVSPVAPGSVSGPNRRAPVESGAAPSPVRARPRVDAHVHLSRWWPEVPRTAYRPDLAYDVRGLLSEMDRSSIDRALVVQMFLAPSVEEALAEGRSSFEASRGRLLPVATVDPTKDADTVEQVLARLDKEAPLFGVKLFPGYLPFYPHDPRVAPVYEFAHRRGIPVLLHQGDTLQGRGLVKFARPLEVDEVAGRYRDVDFVLCHLGNPWIDEAAEVVYKNPNVYADTSGLLPHPLSPYFEDAADQARESIRRAVVATGAPERFLFGSDWPLEALETAAALIEGLRLREEDRARILGENAAQLFDLGRPVTDR